MSKTLTEQLHDLRVSFDAENSRKQAHFATLLKSADEKIARVKNTDYSAPYREKYSALLTAVEGLVNKVQQIENRTHGLFNRTLSEYIKLGSSFTSAQLRSKGEVERVFATMLKCTSEVIQSLSEEEKVNPLDAPKHFEKTLKTLANILCTLRVINKDFTSIMADSGIPKSEYERDLKVAEDEKAQLQNQRAHALKLENLDCYSTYQSVLKQYKDNYARVSKDILGSTSEAMYFDTEYKYLIGFYKEKISKEDTDFAYSVMRLTPAELSCQPVYFQPEKDSHNIVINGLASDFEKPAYQKFIRQLYFSLARRLPANGLKYSAIACNKRTNGMFVSGLENFIKNLSDSGLYMEKGVVSEPSRFASAVGELREKSLHFTTSDNTDIFEFNRRSSIDRKPMYLTFVDSYPIGMEMHLDGIASLQQLMTESKRSGFITVLSQATDAFGKVQGYSDPPPKFENPQKEYDALEINITGNEITVNGKPVTLDIADAGFNENAYVAYWNKLKNYYGKKEIFYLEKLFDDLDRKMASEPQSAPVLLTGKMSVPLGYVGTDLYEAEYDLHKACHALILGSSGSGKSSYLHTFILGTAYKYSPREVQFYLADWKESEFNVYKNNPLPHIKYIQDKSSVPEYVSLLQMILRICSHRNAIIREKGQTSFLGYNAVVSEEERLPFIFFIVDEYQVMLQANSDNTASSSGKRMAKAWQSLMSSILGIVRSAGIGVVLSSQSLENITIDTNNIQKRMLLGLDRELLARLCYNNDSKAKAGDEIKQDEQYLSVAQSGHVVLGFAGKTKTERFRAAYTGDGELRERSIERILDRYPERYEQLILGGSKESFPILEYTNPPYSSMLEESKRETSFDDDFDVSASDDTDYSVFIGVTSNDTTPVALQFNTKGNGYIAYTQSLARMRMLVRGTMLSFLYKTTAYRGRYTAKREYYFGSEDDYLRDIGRVCDEEPFLSPHITSYDVEYDAYNSVCGLMDLYKLFEERKKQRRMRGGFPPTLALFRDIEWLTEKLDDTYEQYEEIARKNASKTRAVEKREEPTDDPELIEMMARYREMFPTYPEEKIRARALNKLGRVASSAPAQAEKTEENKVYEKEEVFEAFKTLFKEGCRFRIFVFVCSSSQGALKSFRDKSFRGNEGAFDKYAVFGSQQENDAKLLDSVSGDGDINTCFVYPAPKPRLEGVSNDGSDGEVGELTRLYKFGINDYDWWDDLEFRLEE